MKRRHFLVAGGLLATGSYINHRALRYPRLSFEPTNPVNKYASAQTQLDLKDLIINQQANNQFSVRAIAPEPKLEITQLESSSNHLSININNLAPSAILKIDAASSVNVHEQISGINRLIEINGLTKQSVSLSWSLADSNTLSFAAIGDSGGGHELEWCLTRAQQLSVDFFLHLGDFNYGNDEYDLAIEKFYNAPMPVYVSIGNHDFNDGGLIYQQFLQKLGPMNHSFVVAGTRFINIDTAVNFFPAYAGNRGDLMRAITSSSKQVDDHVVFTHKPFFDTRIGEDHDISGIGEKNWLYNAMHSIEAKNLLCGHVHLSSEYDHKGIYQWIAGEGLGHEDLVHQAQVSKILIGKVNNELAVNYEWQNLNMPWEMHQSHTHEKKLKDYGNMEQLEWYLESIKS